MPDCIWQLMEPFVDYYVDSAVAYVSVLLYLSGSQLDWLPLPRTMSQGLEIPCGEGDGTPLQSSRLENPMGGGAWWEDEHLSIWNKHLDLFLNKTKQLLLVFQNSSVSVTIFMSKANTEPGGGLATETLPLFWEEM